MSKKYWLFKTEKSTWSWENQVARGDTGEEWDGVRNYQARNFMREMKVGDQGFFYLSQRDKVIVGIVEVITVAHPESSTNDHRWECVDIKAIRSLPTPVSLDQIRADPRLSEMVLVKNSRLSVQPVKEDEWRIVCDLGGLSPEHCRPLD
ncbi:EVE domain-containing protein [Sagittula sp. NFXS13]